MADKAAQRRLATRLAGGVIALLLILVFIWFVQTMMQMKSAKKERVVQTIQVIRPPPPPPPPDEPPPPPPPKTAEQIPKDQPEPEPEQQPEQAPQQPLGIDAEGSAGGDAFGLAARSGGSDLIGGTGTAPYAWYTNRMRDTIKDKLAASPCTKSAKGSMSTRIVVGAEGQVKQIKLVAGTGNAKVDDCVERVLDSIKTLGDAPPPNMPEQVNLKLVF